MAIDDITLTYKAAKDVYYVIWDVENMLAWDSADDVFEDIGTATSPYLTAEEQPLPGGSKLSLYVETLDWSRVVPGPAKYVWVGGYHLKGASPDLDEDRLIGQFGGVVEYGQFRLTQDAVEGIVFSTGTGTILVDQDYGGTNALCYIKDDIPVDNAEVRFYLASDYDAGNLAVEYIKATSRTTVTGAWLKPVMLDPADYVMQFYKQNECGPDAYRLTVLPD